MAAARADEPKPAEPGPWKFGEVLSLNLSQSAFSDNWSGGDKGSIVWVTGSASTAERQFSKRFNSTSALTLAYGQTTRQVADPANPSHNVWDSPDKTTDQILFESTGRFTLASFVDPYVAVRAESQFQDQSSPLGMLNFNPIKLKETAGIARVLQKSADAEAITQRRRWLGDRTALLLGSNAGTANYKGWMDLVEALALLPPARRALVHLLVAGRLPDAAIEQRIAELGLSDQVHFPGLLDDVRPALAAIDAGFVLSWDVETISFACREMMAMGKPVLVSDYAGLPENIRPELDGWLVPPRNHQAMTDCLQRLLEQRADLARMGAAARERAQNEFGLDRFVARTEAAYADLLANR